MTTEDSFKKYPYFIFPAIEALNSAEGEQRRVLVRRIAAGVGPMSALRTLLGVDPDEFRDFYGELSQPDLSTSETIDIFLDKFAPEQSGKSAQSASANSDSEEIPLEVPVAPPAIDYAAVMLNDEFDSEDLPDDDTSSLLNSFLGNTTQQKQAPKQPADNIATEEKIERGDKVDNSEPLSEALVKIMIKNGNYRKALEIITEMNLKNPKKSVYFADQIRFLQKLALLQES